MNKLLTFCVCLLATATLHAQPKPKKQNTDKPPSQKEIEEMMKTLQKGADDMDPADKKMLDSMGFKMPAIGSLPAFTDKQINQRNDDINRLVPLKDAARIASISSTPLTAASLPGFVQSTHSKVAAQLSATIRSKGEEIYRALQSQYHSAAATGNGAAGLWMMGQPQLALYVMGKACNDAPLHANNLSNYAGMLSMCGAGQAAVPILNNLNARFPGNSTILNNLGQAWFELGDMDKAGKYLDSTIRIYALHPQANYTRCFIEESKGNKRGAIEAMKKSIKQGYTKEKESRLKKLGYELTGDDIPWPHKPEVDPLGFKNFRRPAIPHTVNECIQLKNVWEAFREQCQAKAGEVSREMAKAAQQVNASNMQKLTLGQQAMSANTINKLNQLVPYPPFAYKASIKLKALDKDGGHQYRINKLKKDIDDLLAQKDKREKTYEANIKALNKEDQQQNGEGKGRVDFCTKYPRGHGRIHRPLQPETGRAVHRIPKGARTLLERTGIPATVCHARRSVCPV